MILERTSLPSATIATAVSSHDVSMPRTNTTELLNGQTTVYGDIRHHALDIPTPNALTGFHRFAALLLVRLQKIDSFLQLWVVREIVPGQFDLAPVTRRFLLPLQLFCLLRFFHHNIWSNSLAMDLATFRRVVLGSGQ